MGRYRDIEYRIGRHCIARLLEDDSGETQAIKEVQPARIEQRAADVVVDVRREHRSQCRPAGLRPGRSVRDGASR